jgi:hypothetical protein
MQGRIQGGWCWVCVDRGLFVALLLMNGVFKCSQSIARVQEGGVVHVFVRVGRLASVSCSVQG